MGWGGARKLLIVIENVRKALAIEILCAVSGIEHRAPLSPGEKTARLVAKVREVVPPLTADRSPSPDIAAVSDLIESGAIGDLVT
jgi:histidine ammonia-lyase